MTRIKEPVGVWEISLKNRYSCNSNAQHRFLYHSQPLSLVRWTDPPFCANFGQKGESVTKHPTKWGLSNDKFRLRFYHILIHTL